MPTNFGALVVFGAIEQKWLSFGGVGGSLGPPTTNEAPTFDGVGRAQNFQKGIVSWHPATGAHVVWGAIGGRWLEIGREQFGYPLTDEMTCPDNVGKFNHFRTLQIAGTPDCSIYWSPASGAHEIYGAIRDKWASLGWERGAVGYPVGPEHDQPGRGRTQFFQRGVITWIPDGGPAEHEVSGDSVTFESGPVSSSLALGGNVHLVMHQMGNFTFSCNSHGSGFDNIDYGMSAVLVTATGTGFTFAHTGSVEGTIVSLPPPWRAPRRDDHFTISGNNPKISAEWDNIVASGRLLPPSLSGEDTTAAALIDLLGQAAKVVGEAALTVVVALV